VAVPDRDEQREAVELAFVAALQHLPPRQRAVLILREVLGYSALEVASALDTTVPSVNSALQRARRSLDERMPAATQHANARELGDARMQALVAEFTDAWMACDLERLRTLLADDATFSMPPNGEWWHGADTIVAMREHARDLCPEGRWLPVESNGQVAFGCYTLDGDTFLPAAIWVFTFRGAVVSDITSFVSPGLFPRFGLPPTA
jgi:RNA polymerase sigma-70 factor, ECF subfamily